MQPKVMQYLMVDYKLNLIVADSRIIKNFF